MDADSQVVVAVDAMGGDNAPDVVLEGISRALDEDRNMGVLLLGEESVVVPFASRFDRVVAKPTTETIAMDEHPVPAVRSKKDSSIVVGCRAVKDGEADAFFSAGSTGACLVAATLVMGRIHGIRRPALASVIPTPFHPVILCDMGANADCKPADLLQFAQMADIYVRFTLGVDNPKIALLNNGTESTKGSTFTQEAFGLLEKGLPDFAGNAEGCDILNAKYDVFVTDGFTGNVVLKALEGSTKTVFKCIKDIIMASTRTKLAGAALKPGIKKLMTEVNADAYGAAPLLGIDGYCLVAHGSSNVDAIANGLHQTCQDVREDLVGTLTAMAAGQTKG